MLTQEQLTQLNDEVAGLRPVSPLPKYQVEEADSYAFTPEAAKPAEPLPQNYQSTQVCEGFADLTFPSLTQENHTPEDFQEAFKEKLPEVASFIGDAADRVETSVAANAISQMEEDDNLKTLEAWKVYTNTRPDVLREVRNMSIETGIPEKAILYSPEALNRTRNIYNYRRKQMALSMPGGKNDPGLNEVSIDQLTEAYPGLDKIIKSDSVAEAGIALENIENIRQMKGYLDAGIFGVKKGLKQREMQRVGKSAWETGRDVTEAELKKYRELEEEYKSMPEAPDFLDSPLVSLIGRTAEQLPQQAFGLAKGGAYGLAGAGVAVIPTVALAPVTGGTTLAAAPAAAKYGFGIGMRVGYAEDMFTHSAAQRYIEYSQYKDENGKRVLTNAEAQAYASVAAALETGIEFANADTILKVLKGNKSIAAAQIRNIVTGAKDTASLIAGFKQILSGAKTITLSEDIEEGAQEVGDRLLSNVAHAIWGGNIPTYSAGEVAMGGLEAMANAFLPSLGFSMIAGGSGSFKLVRRAAAISELNNEEFKGWWKNVNGLGVINKMMSDEGILKFFKEDPDVAKKTLQGTVEGTGFENVNIDTEYARKKENGEEALREVGKAAGLSDETVQAAIDTNATLSVPTAVYFQTRANQENFALGDDVLTFSDEAPCLAREKEYYEAKKAQLDAIMESANARQIAQQTEAIDRIVKEKFEDETDIELATAALMLNPRNPEKGWREIRDDYQGKVDEILAPIMETVRRLAPENVSDEELRNTAMAILTGTYEGAFPDYLKTPEMQELFGANAVQMQALQASLNRLDAIKEKIKSIDAGDLQTMEGMSQEAYAVYRDLTNIINSGAPNEMVKRSGQWFAALFARNADIYAASKRAEGNENYTAADYYREMFGLEMGGEYNAEDGGGLFQVSPDVLKQQKEDVRKQYQGTDQWMKAPNGEDTNLSEDQWVTVRTDAFKNWFGDWENDPANASKVLDENGEPKVMYHETNNTFDTFDIKHKGAGTNDRQTPYGVFLKPTSKGIGLGQTQMQLFANVRNPLRFADRAELNAWLIKNVPQYKDIFAERNKKVREYNNQYEKLQKVSDEEYNTIYQQWKNGNITKEEFDKKVDKLLENDPSDTVFNEMLQYEDKKDNELKNLLDEYMRKRGADGVVLSRDEGEGGTVNTTIAFLNTQVKDATGRNVGFDPENNNIYFQKKGTGGPAAFFEGFDVSTVGVTKLSEAYKKILDRKETDQKENKIKFVSSSGVTYLEERIVHAAKKHSLTEAELDDINNHMDQLLDAAISKRKGSYHGTSVLARIQGDLANYSVVLEFVPNGNVFFKTAAKNTVHGSQTWINEKSAKRLSPATSADPVSVGRSINSIKQELGIVNNNSVQGMTRRMENGKRIMNVFNSGNESTMVHELGHIFLMNLMDMAAMKNAPERIVKDLELVKEWLGWQPDQTDFTREQHEKFAKGFEAYLRTGAAPSTGLKKVFRKFKKWLNRIYRDFLMLGGRPSDEIQKVMGRMIASEEEVEEAFILRGSEFFEKSRSTKQLDTTSFAMYQRWKDEAQEYAEEKVLARAMNDLTEKRKQELESTRQKLEEDIQARLKEEPVYKAEALLEANPAMKDNFPAEQLGITYEEYQEQIKERGSIEEETKKLVDAAMQEIEDKMPVAEIKEAAEQAVNSSEYRALYLAFERRFIVEKQMRTDRLTQGIEAALDALEKDIVAEEPDVAKLKDRLSALRAQTRWTVKEMNLINRMVLAAEQMAQKEAVAQAKETAAEKLAGEKTKAEAKLVEVKTKAAEKLAGQKERAEAKLTETKTKAAENIEAQRERVRQGRETLKSTIKNFRELVKETRDHVHIYRDTAFADRKIIRQYAEEKMAAMNIPDATNVTKWRNKDRTSGHQAAEALRKALSASLRSNGTQEAQEKLSKLWQEANDLKTQQLVYAEMAAIAQRNADIVRKKNARLKTRMKSIRKNNSVPVQERYMYHHGLFVLGLEKQDAPVPQNKPDILSMFQYYADDMSAYFLDEEGNVWLPEYLIAAMAGADIYKETGYKSLTMEQYGEFTDALDTIYRVGMDANKTKTVKDPSGQEVNLDVAINSIVAETESRVYEIENADTTNAGSPTFGQRMWNKAREGKVKLTKVESVLEWMGPAAERYIYEPVNRARTKEMVMLEQVAAKVSSLWSKYTLTERSEMRSKKQFQFGTSVLTREEMMCVALNWGTEINKRRVMEGFRVTEDTVMDLLSNMTEKDWQTVEGMWELTNSFWDDTVATEEAVAGIAPKKEEAVPFTVMGKDGKIYDLKGGYYHIKYDPSKSLRMANKEQDDIARQNMRNSSAMNRNLGFTKQRSSGPVKHPLLLSFDVFSKNLYDVVHNICFREALRDVRRILTNDRVVDTITSHFGQYQAEVMQQWVLDCWAREKVGLGAMDQLMRFFRHKQTAAALGYNIKTALLNSLNIFPMTHYLGVTRTQQAITDFYENREANWSFCLSKSTFLRERAETMDRDAGEVLRDEFQGGSGIVIDSLEMGTKLVSKSAFKVMALTDLMLANPLWLAEYQRVYQDMMAAAGPNVSDQMLQRIDEEAISAGDKAVRKVFGSGDIKDLAPIQKGSELDKLLTMYYSYFNVVFNALFSGYAKGRMQSKQNNTAYHIPSFVPFIGGAEVKIEIRPVVEAFLYWTVLTGVSEGLFRKGAEVAAGNDDGEDGWLMAMFKGWRDNTIGTIPYIRDVFASAMDIMMGERYYGARPLPAYGVLDNFQRLWSAIIKDKKTKIDVFREGSRLANQFSGVSNTVTDAFATTAYWVDTDFDTPFYQYLAAVLLDKRIDKKKKKK